MSMNHLMSDFVARVNNANMINKEEVNVLKNKLVTEVSKKLATLGYINSFEESGNQLILDLKPGKIKSISIISKPGQRQYCGANDIPKVIGGIGYTILTTSQGIMTHVEASKAKVGGEVLFQIY